ncbi:ABC transporter substrate-binding protein [Paracoccus benzoatiresistens]|uniref:ABC transporter substrate-binding protein n=1 Tax=Paracoccus benzoatiresistens TaxID=2997341 RepID=A0ABT4J7Y4_9RHOB|nr:ABC transporter substrate-binding protein [Paracoccus sp. EF6]MCZ0963246.1 ABC transporter substrate-binding protein [Paracoccus sp. EF6]
MMTVFDRRSLLRTASISGRAALAAPGLLRAQALDEIRIDWATYNPVSMLLRDKGWLEQEFQGDGTRITWLQSAGSNKALEFLNASAIDFGWTAGSAALVARVNGNPVKAIHSFSRPEWTALVTRADTDIGTVADLKGKSVAVTRGTDPHVFLIRALADAGLTERDLTPVLL